MKPRIASPNALKSGSASPLNEYWSVRLVQLPQIVLLTRTSEPFQTVAEIERCIEDFSRFIPGSKRAGWRIIIDARLGPTRVHPALDPAFERFRKETHAGFAGVAVIVSTTLGRVRAERLSNISKVPVCVVSSLEDACAFLNTL